MLTISSLTLGVRIVNLLKEVVVASRFGTSDTMDSFLIAFLYASMPILLVAGSLNIALLPTFIEVRERPDGELAAARLLASTLVVTAVLLTCAALLSAALIPPALPWLARGFGPEKLAVTRRMFFWLLPALVLNGVSMLLSAALNARGRFALAALAPVARPFAVMGFVLLLARGGTALVAGTASGLAVELGMVAWALHRIGMSIVPRWHGSTPELRQVLRQFLPVVAGVIATSGTELVDQTMAATLPPGSVSIFAYGNRFVNVVTALGVTTIATAVLPHFSSMVARKEWTALRRTLKVYGWGVLLGSLVPTVILIGFSRLVIELVLQRGAFSPDDTALVARVQAASAIQIPFYLLSVLALRLVMSLKGNVFLMWGAILGFVVNFVFDYILMKLMGVAGLAMATSVVYFVNLVFVTLVVRSLLRKAAG